VRQVQILEILREHQRTRGKPLGLRALARAVGLAPSRVHQHLEALFRKGMLEREGGVYRPTPMAVRSVPGILDDGTELDSGA
jgi:DNA-binding IclR family transcriptional regulator